MDVPIRQRKIKWSAKLRRSHFPKALDESIRGIVANYTVGFLRIENDEQGKKPVLIGSGTLVTANGIHAILTAHHVIDVLPVRDELGLIYSENQKLGTLPSGRLRYLKIDRGAVDSEGPDLGAVILPRPLAASLGAIKSFHNLDRRRSELLTSPPALADGLWVVQGFVDERTEEESDPDEGTRTVRFFQLSSLGSARPYNIDNYDYFEVPIRYEDDRPIPESYGGTSGGGLWQVPLHKRGSDGEITLDLIPILSGVAFYQSPIESRLSSIKCHGRRSVYDVAYEAIRQTSDAT